MSPKPKAPPQNPLVYWWNEFLFARSFVYTTPLSPEECRKALLEIGHPVEGGWFSFNPVSKTVEIHREQPDTNSPARFDIRLKRRNRGIHYTMAKAEGRIAYDEQSGETTVQGRTKFGALQYLLVVVYVVVFGLIFLNMSSLVGGFPYFWILFALIFALSFTWWRMYSDRNYLTDLIGTTLREAEFTPPESLKQKRGDDDDVIGSLMENDESSAQRWKRR
jgi:hypothetical protein